MKTLKDLFELVAQAVEQNKKERRTWFIDFSGHVNQIKIQYWYIGWKPQYPASEESLTEELTEDGIQSAYWFIKTRLNE